MKTDRVKLIDALNLVSPGLANAEVIEQSTCFAFDDGRVFTYNDEIAVSAPVEIELEGAIQAKEFLALVKRSKSKEVDLEIKDGELRLTSSKAKAGIVLDDEIRLPLDELGKPEDWKDLPFNFIPAISFCLFSASTDLSSPSLTCLHIKELYVESCDNYRITSYDMYDDKNEDDPGFEEAILLPAASARQIKNHDITEYTLTEGWIHFRGKNDVIVSCRTMEEDWKDLTDFIEVKGEPMDLPPELGEALSKAQIFTASENTDIVNATLSKNKLTIRGEGAVGWYEESAKVKYSGKELNFDVNAAHLKQIIDDEADCEICENCLKFIRNEYIHIVALVAGDN